MKFTLTILAVLIVGIGSVGCSAGANEGNTGEAAREVLKEAPKSTGKYDDMPEPGGSIGERGGGTAPKGGK